MGSSSYGKDTLMRLGVVLGRPAIVLDPPVALEYFKDRGIIPPLVKKVVVCDDPRTGLFVDFEVNERNYRICLNWDGRVAVIDCTGEDSEPRGWLPPIVLERRF